jgi:nucleoside diphosphate-linked moiety X motif protein 19
LKKEFCIGSGSNKSFIFQNNDESRLQRGISLRLTALRETFEELGVILGGKSLDSIKSSSPYSKAFIDCDIPEWQTKIHNQHETFLLFCEKHGLLPDLWNTYEWSTWLTPTFFRPRRFETAFFLLALNEKPEIHPESVHEVEEFMVIDDALPYGIRAVSKLSWV